MSDPLVRHFRQILIWPLQLMPLAHGQMGRQWELMQQAVSKSASPWEARSTEFDCPPEEFQERHYREFVTFLPYVQRFLYGEGITEVADAASWGRSPMHVFRRTDIRTVRMSYKDGARADFRVAHIDLYFFFDIDVAILAFEIMADDLPMRRVQDTMFRLGRAFPAQWDEEEHATNCPTRVEWLGADGAVLCESDYEDRKAFLAHVGEFRSTRMAAHWDFLLHPLVPHHSDEEGAIRYRQLEYHRMPLMAYLSFDDPFALREEDFYRLGMVTKPGDGDALPYSPRVFEEFERNCCYDRFWVPERRHPATSTRMMCNGHAFVLVGMHGNAFFSDPRTGALGQFRHQHFLLTMVAHFHKASLLLFRDRLAVAMSQLNIRNDISVRLFKREIRQCLEGFLRFNQRYWFREVSNQVLTDQLFQMLRRHLDTESLFTDVRESVHGMNQYLENDDLRRQADTVVRLTVVTILGMIGTTVTGFLGMNLFDYAGQSPGAKLGIFLLALLPVFLLTLLTVVKSRQLSEFLDGVADQRLRWPAKLQLLGRVFRRKK
ncbi:hypothetical protein [Chitinilyticum litopenaei]|uniref:hypothetical protein n=1 Tax=Chitinilyticum litopenaei TaxID=1121276 RepID=UPI0003F71958|nr:hypothetical protein [Chitinilyticum litopenaei]